MKTIPYPDYPGTPQLVAEALAGNARLEFGFPVNVDAAEWKKRSEEEARRDRPRKEVVAQLKKTAADVEYHANAQANLDALAQPGTLAVVTGQQVGIAGGPLLTLYKALTAIAVARKLERESGVRTVPVFWMATSDHKFAEVGRAWWIDLKNELQEFKRDDPDNRRPCGSIELGDAATELLERLYEDLPESDFKPALMELLKTAYEPETTYGAAFHRLLANWLTRFGMVFLDAEDSGLKQLSRPFWKQTVEQTSERLALQIERSRALEAAGYTAQVPIQADRPALFLLDEGERRKIILSEHARRGRADVVLTTKELLRIADTEPERFSIGVTLRPHWQQWLLPAGAYVAGPHEMAYWSQLAGTFEPLDLPAPAVIHRAGFTLVEKKVRRKLDKLETEVGAFFGDLEELRDRLLRAGMQGDVLASFTKVRAEAENCHRELSKQADGVYSGMEQQVTQTFEKIEYHLDKLEQQFKQRRKQADQALSGGFDTVTLHLRPDGVFQERRLSPVYYLARYGDTLLEGLLKAAERYDEGHLIADLEELTR